jgi:hypothetical protein
MSMPGFSAEKSLLRIHQHYQIVRSIDQSGITTHAARLLAQRAAPQASSLLSSPIGPPHCFSFCYCDTNCRRVCEIVCSPDTPNPILDVQQQTLKLA